MDFDILLIDLNILLIVAAMIGAVALGVGFDRVREKRRAEAWRALASSLGLRFLGADENFELRHPAFKIFSRGRDRKAVNVAEGSSGKTRVCLADYRWTTGGGKSRTVHRRTVCVLEREGLALPHFYLRPQGFLDSVGKLFGGQDIDFPEDPAFSKAFVLQGESEGAARGCFDRRVREWMLSRQAWGLEVEARGGKIVFSGPPHQETRSARALLDMALEFMMLWI